MRTSVLTLFTLLASPALASSVLLISTDRARELDLVDDVAGTLQDQGFELKVAGPRVGVACLTEPDAKRRSCLADAATLAHMATVAFFTAEKGADGMVSATIEVISQANGKLVKALTFRASAVKWAQLSPGAVKTLKKVIAPQAFVAREVVRAQAPATAPQAQKDEAPPTDEKTDAPKKVDPEAK